MWVLPLSELCVLSEYYIKCVPSTIFTAGNGK